MRSWAELRASHDPHGMFERIRGLPEQIEDAAARFRASAPGLRAPDAGAVLLLGMGGSAIGGEIAAALLGGSARLPVVVSRGYSVPAWCGPSSLAIAVSYSGNTEETLAAWEEARASGARLAAITSGGELADRAAAVGAPLVFVPGGFPPRAAIGHLAVSLLLLLEEAGFPAPGAGEIGEAARHLAGRREAWGFADGPSEGEPARLAGLLAGRFPFVYHAGGENGPIARRWRGQLAENAKMLSHDAAFPEANHNEIVGWSAGAAGGAGLSPVLLHLAGGADPERVRLGMETALARIADETGLPVVRVEGEGPSPLARIFAGVYLADCTSYLLALRRGIDPTPVRAIEELKLRLARGPAAARPAPGGGGRDA